MFAIIEFKGKQLRVESDKEYKLPYYDCKEGDSFSPEKILIISDEKKTILEDKDLEKAKVNGTVVAVGQDKKISVVKFHSKKRYQKLGGHRQDFVKVKIEQIVV